ncbi:hypothetical protein WDW89_22005 [Deltaproteobacteria bacterium TL4]
MTDTNVSNASKILLKEAPFCLMDFQTNKVVFENISRFKGFYQRFPTTHGILNNNIYSGLLRKYRIDDLDRIYQWIEAVLFQKVSLEELGRNAPQLKLEEEEATCELKFSIYSRKQAPTFLIIQLVDASDINVQHESALVQMYLDEYYRGIGFGEAFYNYSFKDLRTHYEGIQSKSFTPEDVLESYVDIQTQCGEIQKTTTWLQVHKMTELCELIQDRLEKAKSNPLSKEWFEDYRFALSTLWDMITLGDVIAVYFNYKKDIGYHRTRENPWGLDERQYRDLINDFEVLRQIVKYDKTHAILEKQVSKCFNHLIKIDNELINQTFVRVKLIAADLSYQLEKSIQFTLQDPLIILSSHYAQHGICRYLINTLRYIIVEHIEIPKERKLMGKSFVAKIQLAIENDGDNLNFIYSDDGMCFDTKLIVERALEKNIITATMADWLLNQNPSEIYNLMLKAEFGPPIKPPPVTLYKPYLSMIAAEVESLQAKMSFYRKDETNFIKLQLPKAPNGITIQLEDEQIDFSKLFISDNY